MRIRTLEQTKTDIVDHVKFGWVIESAIIKRFNLYEIGLKHLISGSRVDLKVNPNAGKDTLINLLDEKELLR